MRKTRRGTLGPTNMAGAKYKVGRVLLGCAWPTPPMLLNPSIYAHPHRHAPRQKKRKRQMQQKRELEERRWQELEEQRNGGHSSSATTDGPLDAAAALSAKAEGHESAGALKDALKAYASAVKTLMPHLQIEGVVERVEVLMAKAEVLKATLAARKKAGAEANAGGNAGSEAGTVEEKPSGAPPKKRQRTEADLTVAVPSGGVDVAAAARLLSTQGLCILRKAADPSAAGCFDAATLRQLREASGRVETSVLRACRARGIVDPNTGFAFHEVASRCPNRFDFRLLDTSAGGGDQALQEVSTGASLWRWPERCTRARPDTQHPRVLASRLWSASPGPVLRTTTGGCRSPASYLGPTRNLRTWGSSSLVPEPSRSPFTWMART